MGSYERAETCELVVVYMLSQLKSFCGNTIGLDRDDGLAAFHDPPRLIERIKQQICQLLVDNGLKITIEANKKVINYLDVTLDLNSGKHYPFMKPGNVPTYVHAKSNHPPCILKRIPESVNQRLSDILSDQSGFNNAVPTIPSGPGQEWVPIYIEIPTKSEQRKDWQYKEKEHHLV